MFRRRVRGGGCLFWVSENTLAPGLRSRWQPRVPQQRGHHGRLGAVPAVAPSQSVHKQNLSLSTPIVSVSTCRRAVGTQRVLYSGDRL